MGDDGSVGEFVGIGVLTTFARVFDAFTDIFMGVIADRTKSMWGRFRPWILRAGPV